MIVAGTESICVFEEGDIPLPSGGEPQNVRPVGAMGLEGSQRKEGTIEIRRNCINPNDRCLCDGYFIIGSNGELP